MQNAIAQMQKQAATGAADHLLGIKVLARTLADELKKAHGGDWRIQIDPEADFIMVARRRDRHIAKPKRGEVA